jgi:pre-rRNA-processing protein TSR2
VTNQWGGPDSASKREWFASQTIDLLNDTPDADAEWLEEFMLNVMLDEFEVNVDDESAYEVAEQILRIKKNCLKGEFAEVTEMKEKWDARRGAEDLGKVFERRERGEEEDETDGSDEGDEDGDVDMDEAPALGRTREPVVPEVDEEGFTKVTKKKR